jgi:hypothetical protein
MIKTLVIGVVGLAFVAGCGGATVQESTGPLTGRTNGPVAGRTNAPVAGRSGEPTIRSTSGVPAGATPLPTIGPVPSIALPTTGPGPTTGAPETTPFPIPTQELPQVTSPPTPPPNPDSLGAPDWVQAGTRITFYQAAASVAQSRFAWVEDPSGEWTVAATGKHYRRTDESGEGVGTASGDGVSQVDIVAVEGTNVVGNLSLYGIDHNYNQFVVGPSSGWQVAGKVVDGVWVNPDYLAQLETQNLGGLLVLRGPYPVGNLFYDAVSFANPTPGAYSSYTYDTKTGLLLAATTSTAGATSPITAANEPPPVGNTQLTITRLSGARQRTPPGVNGTNPDWVARTRELDYAGTYNFVNPVDPSSANVTFPMNATVQLGQGGRNWTSFQAQSLIQMPGGTQSQTSGVTSTTGLYWIDPAALQGLTAGQVLDNDPITGERDIVLSLDQASNGPTVTLDYRLAGIESQQTYDLATGVLLQVTVFTQSNGTTVRLALQQLP